MIMNASRNALQMLQGQTLLITGSTGLIGSSIVKDLLDIKNAELKILALVRNEEKGRCVFQNYLTDSRLSLILGDVCDRLELACGVDYIIHTASQTSSRAFVEQPVETSLTALKGTENLLNLAVGKNVKGFLYLSSMEVYGTPGDDSKITEDHPTNLNTTDVRTCYPESKRMCESLCVSFASEYGVPVKIVRLTQTFGPGVQYHDDRVFAEFARCVIEGKDIVLHTKGDTKRNYLYTDDAVSAILTVLLCGVPGEAYNAANETTYCSIYEMATMVAEQIAEGAIKVRCEIEDTGKFGYAKTLHMNLDTTKLRDLGWEAKVDLPEMFAKMIADMRRYVSADQT